jgi:LysR family transcriptional regulator, flagellar master operon regulator
MDVKVFRTFLELARVRHFGRAAENLYLTQAAVSARIKQLENYFDAQLFTRDRNNIKLTSAGERLVAYADIMVNTLQQAKFELSLESGKVHQISLGGTANIWDGYLQRSLTNIIQALHGYGFIAEVLGREQLGRGLLERTMDIAFTFDPIKVEELSCKKVAELKLVLVTSETDIQDYFGYHYVYVDWGTKFASEHAERHPNIPAPFLRTSTAKIALDFVLDKGGSAYLPLSIVQTYLDNKSLHLVENVDEWMRPIYLSYRKNNGSADAILQVEKLVNELESFPAI